MKIEVRLATDQDLEFELRQTIREGWSTCRERLALLLAHDPDGCFVAEVGGQRIGMATSTAFALSGWVGNVIVEPAWRGQGIGRRLVEQTLARLEARGLATVRLDGDPPGIPLYRSLGFVEEYESCRAVGGGPWRVNVDGVEPLADADFEELLAMDRRVFGDDRSRLLALLRAGAEAALVTRRKGGLAGFAFLSPSLQSVQLGPFAADSPEAARRLLHACLARVGARQVVAGFPAANPDAEALFASHGFQRVASSLRMVRGRLDAVGEPARVFGIASGATG
jgi:predicted N-acetyltransferase YhbS